MNIAMVGYGKMGKIIVQRGIEKGHAFPVIIDPQDNSSEVTHTALTVKSLAGCHVVIDFSHPSVALDNLRVYAKAGAKVVMGTTGWYDKMSEVEALFANATEACSTADNSAIEGSKFEEGSGQTSTSSTLNPSACIWSGNFSIGVNLLFAMIRKVAPMVDQIEEYDTFVHEYHHKQKADSPSGTATMIGDILLQSLSQKDTVVTDALQRPIKPNELHISSTRGGYVPGTHTITFDGPADTKEITHQARNREGFAHGALLAAQWLVNKTGELGTTSSLNTNRTSSTTDEPSVSRFFTIDQMMADILSLDSNKEALA